MARIIICDDDKTMTARLVAALHDLLVVVPNERRPVLEEQLELLEEAVRQVPRDERDLDMALTPDAQGIGVAACDETPFHESAPPQADTHESVSDRSSPASR